SDQLERVAPALHRELEEGVASARGRRGPEHLDPGARQRRVEVGPSAIRVRDEPRRARRIRNALRERKVDLLQSQGDRTRFSRRCEDDAVVADDELDDLPDAVPGAVLDLGALDAPRRVHDVRMANAEAVAEQLDAAAAAGRLDLRRLEARRAPEAFGDDRRE